MLDPVGFWSYARLDDAHSDGQLSQLRAIVGKAIGLQFGGEVTLWQDVAAIPHGADWAETIERTIGQTTFFIPIVTPRYLKSDNCRDEFRAFRERMQRLGRNDLIFPVHYVNVDNIRPEETAFGDDLAALRRSQWIDFRPLFYADPKSPEVRRWAGDLAGSVLGAVRRATAAPAAVESPPPSPPAESLEPTVAVSEPPPPFEVSPPALARSATATRGSRGEWIAAAVVALGLVAAAIGYFQTRKTADIAALPSPTPTAVAAPAASPSPTPAKVAEARSAPAPTVSPSPKPPPMTVGPCGGVTTASLRSRGVGALTADEACALQRGDVFKECADCPAMVVVPAGSFTMGSADSESGRYPGEGPRHEVKIAAPFAAGKFDVTKDEFAAFVKDTGYDAGANWKNPGFTQTGSHPVVTVNWGDANAYVKWLSTKTGATYRLLSESEWEYAARAETTTAYFWGDAVGTNNAHCDGCGSRWDNKQTSPVGSFAPNAFGLYDMHGDVWQWVQDCYRDSYNGAPNDGSPIVFGECGRRVVRGGSWYDFPRNLRAASRDGCDPSIRYIGLGFRVARTLPL